MDAMTIGDLARLADVAPRTIRFYEQKSLMPEPSRAASGYRIYGQDDLKRLLLIRRARSLGFSLSEVSGVVQLAQHERCDSFQGQVAQMMIAKLVEVDASIQHLSATRKELQESLGNLNGSDCRQDVYECGCDRLGLGT